MSALVQGTQQWLDFRKNKIGASDAPVILGLSPWMTPFQLWEEKLGFSSPKVTTKSMKRGNDLEETARKKFEQETGVLVFPMVCLHEKYDFIMASLDGITLDMKNIVEIKCPGKEDHSLALSGVIPEKYYPQLQHQMMVTGVKMAYYYSFDGQEGVTVEVNRDEKYIEKILKKEIEFWNCLQTLEAPKLTDKDFIKRNDDIWLEAEKKWLECNQKLEQLKESEEKLRGELIQLAGKSNTQGSCLSLTKVIRKGLVDYRCVPQLQNVDLDKYRKESTESWRITKISI